SWPTACSAPPCAAHWTPVARPASGRSERPSTPRSGNSGSRSAGARRGRARVKFSEMIALARKYRPKQFADLIVQDHVAAALRGAVAQNRVAHGYLLAGPRGVGKTTAARSLAMAHNWKRRSAAGEPCGECDSCRRIWGGAVNLDVV